MIYTMNNISKLFINTINQYIEKGYTINIGKLFSGRSDELQAISLSSKEDIVWISIRSMYEMYNINNVNRTSKIITLNSDSTLHGDYIIKALYEVSDNCYTDSVDELVEILKKQNDRHENLFADISDYKSPNLIKHDNIKALLSNRIFKYNGYYINPNSIEYACIRKCGFDKCKSKKISVMYKINNTYDVVIIPV